MPSKSEVILLDGLTVRAVRHGAPIFTRACMRLGKMTPFSEFSRNRMHRIFNIYFPLAFLFVDLFAAATTSSSSSSTTTTTTTTNDPPYFGKCPFSSALLSCCLQTNRSIWRCSLDTLSQNCLLVRGNRKSQPQIKFRLSRGRDEK